MPSAGGSKRSGSNTADALAERRAHHAEWKRRYRAKKRAMVEAATGGGVVKAAESTPAPTVTKSIVVYVLGYGFTNIRVPLAETWAAFAIRVASLRKWPSAILKVRDTYGDLVVPAPSKSARQAGFILVSSKDETHSTPADERSKCDQCLFVGEDQCCSMEFDDEAVQPDTTGCPDAPVEATAAAVGPSLPQSAEPASPNGQRSAEARPPTPPLSRAVTPHATPTRTPVSAPIPCAACIAADFVCTRTATPSAPLSSAACPSPPRALAIPPVLDRSLPVPFPLSAPDIGYISAGAGAVVAVWCVVAIPQVTLAAAAQQARRDPPDPVALGVPLTVSMDSGAREAVMMASGPLGAVGGVHDDDELIDDAIDDEQGVDQAEVNTPPQCPSHAATQPQSPAAAANAAAEAAAVVVSAAAAGPSGVVVPPCAAQAPPVARKRGRPPSAAVAAARAAAAAASSMAQSTAGAAPPPKVSRSGVAASSAPWASAATEGEGRAGTAKVTSTADTAASRVRATGVTTDAHEDVRSEDGRVGGETAGDSEIMHDDNRLDGDDGDDASQGSNVGSSGRLDGDDLEAVTRAFDTDGVRDDDIGSNVSSGDRWRGSRKDAWSGHNSAPSAREAFEAAQSSAIGVRYGHGAIAAAARGQMRVLSVPFVPARPIPDAPPPSVAADGVVVPMYCVTWSPAEGGAEALWMAAPLVPVSLRIALHALQHPVRTPAPQCVLSRFRSRQERIRAVAALERYFVETHGPFAIRPPPPWSPGGAQSFVAGGLPPESSSSIRG